MLLVASCYRNRDKLRPDGLLGSHANFTFLPLLPVAVYLISSSWCYIYISRIRDNFYACFLKRQQYHRESVPLSAKTVITFWVAMPLAMPYTLAWEKRLWHFFVVVLQPHKFYWFWFSWVWIHVAAKLIKFSDAVKFTMNVTSASWTIHFFVAFHLLFTGKYTPETTLALVVVSSNAFHCVYQSTFIYQV